MKLLVHDMAAADFRRVFPEPPVDGVIISPASRVHACIGCDACWLKTPGVCPIRDDLTSLVQNLSATDELILMTRCVYGCVSPFVKNVLDRMKGYLMPVMELRNGEPRLKVRYEGHFLLRVICLGEPSALEKASLEAFVSRFAEDYAVSTFAVSYVSKAEELRGMMS